ncbi:MAG: MFS transporter [Candidatus Bathyarchaeia archaeon]
MQRRTMLKAFQSLLAITFLFQLALGIVSLSVPIFAAFLGASPFLIGLIGSMGGLIYSFMPLILGAISDRFNRKILVSASILLYVVVCILYSLIKNPVLLLAVKLLEGISISAFWPSIESLITDSSSSSLQETVKKFNISWGSAMIIAPLIGGALISEFSTQISFIVSLFMAFIAFIICFVSVKELPIRHKEKTELITTVKGQKNNLILIVPALMSILLFSSIGGIIMTLFPAYAVYLGIQAYQIGSITFASGLSRMLAFFWAPKLERRMGKNRMFIFSSVIFALASLLTIFSSNAEMFTLSFLVFGLGSGISYAAAISAIFEHWKTTRGYAAGLFESLIGIGSFTGPLIGGAISEYMLNAPYYFSLAASIFVCFAQIVLSQAIKIKD